MSLFPAYGQSTLDVCMQSNSDELEEGSDLSPGAETSLLSEEARSPPRAAPRPLPSAPTDYYFDRKLDCGNLRVSTLYYPARPEYRTRDCTALGVKLRGGDRGGGKVRGRRYWRRAPPVAPAPDAAEIAARATDLRRALADTPLDEQLWLRYIDFLEWSSECGAAGGADGAAEVAEAAWKAVALLPSSAALRSRAHAALRRALDPSELAARLAQMRADEECGLARAELWAREVSALACAGALEAARGAAARAARDRRAAAHHHLVLLVYGCVLRSAGLWEQLVQLIELLGAMEFPPAPGFPPAPDPARVQAAEQQLHAWEERAVSSGLPRDAVWSRVELARAAVHWRPACEAASLELAADPQRAPPPAAAADLLVPAAGELRLLAALLRMAETPLLPVANWVSAAAGGSVSAGEVCAEWEGGAGLALLALVRAARRLPPAHPARAALAPPAAARRLLAHTPLRDVPASPALDTTGFGAWKRALWSAALGWAKNAGDAALTAFLCWRLRELHARLLLAINNEEIRALRSEARELLRVWSGGGALPFAVFARLEAAAGGASRGVRAARQAARHALQQAASVEATEYDRHVALYAARVVWELCGAEGAAAGEWALACAASRRALPPDDALQRAPAADVLRAAREQCDKQCDLLERQYESDYEDGTGGLVWALLPGAAEWGAARCLLAPPEQRPALLLRIKEAAAWCAGAGAGARYREQCACALAAAGARQHRAAHVARELAPSFPGNAYLALLSTGSSVWESGASPGAAPRGSLATWAALLAPLLRAAAPDASPAEGLYVWRACGRALRTAGADGGALLHALRAGAAPDPRPATTHALATAGHSKWLLVRGAALGATAAGAMADLALERALRLHALPDELEPLPAQQTQPTRADIQQTQ